MPSDSDTLVKGVLMKIGAVIFCVYIPPATRTFLFQMKIGIRDLHTDLGIY